MALVWQAAIPEMKFRSTTIDVHGDVLKLSRMEAHSGSDTDHMPGQDTEAVERELTQTDHLNQRLLSSFLDRINNDPTFVSNAMSTTSTGLVQMTSSAEGNGNNDDFSDTDMQVNPSCPEAHSKSGNMHDNETETVEREITQTDHLNQRLLSSFLDRINTNPTFVNAMSAELAQMTTAEDNTNDDSFSEHPETNVPCSNQTDTAISESK